MNLGNIFTTDNKPDKDKRDSYQFELTPKSKPFLYNQVDLYLNLLRLKIYALIVCRGDVKDKSEYLWNLIINDCWDNHHTEITWKNKRFKQIIYLFIYFNELLPKHYVHTYTDDPLANDLEHLQIKVKYKNKNI